MRLFDAYFDLRVEGRRHKKKLLFFRNWKLNFPNVQIYPRQFHHIELMIFFFNLFPGLLMLDEELYSQWLINRIEQVNIKFQFPNPTKRFQSKNINCNLWFVMPESDNTTLIPSRMQFIPGFSKNCDLRKSIFNFHHIILAQKFRNVMHFNKLKISTVHLSKNVRAVGSGGEKVRRFAI